jgi:hypothetical protein
MSGSAASFVRLGIAMTDTDHAGERYDYEQRHQTAFASPYPDPGADRTDHLGRQGSGHQISGNRAVAAAQGRTQRASDPDRRRRVRLQQRFWRIMPDTEFGKAGGRRTEIQPLSHHRPLLPDACGAADRTQPPFLRHGRHHRDRHRCPGLQLGIAQYDLTAGPNPEAQRLLDRAIWQMPRSAGVGDQPGRAV